MEGFWRRAPQRFSHPANASVAKAFAPFLCDPHNVMHAFARAIIQGARVHAPLEAVPHPRRGVDDAL
jgi:hypothetical protein